MDVILFYGVDQLFAALASEVVHASVMETDMEHWSPMVADAETASETLTEPVDSPATVVEESVGVIPQAEGTEVDVLAVWELDDGLESWTTNWEVEPA